MAFLDDLISGITSAIGPAVVETGLGALAGSQKASQQEDLEEKKAELALEAQREADLVRQAIASQQIEAQNKQQAFTSLLQAILQGGALKSNALGNLARTGRG